VIVNDWFWGGGAPDATIIPWTWLTVPLELRVDQPINAASITRTGFDTRTAVNAASKTTFGTFPASGSLDTASTDDAANYAAFLVAYYNNPKLRCPTITISLENRNTEDIWAVLGREIGDRITLGPGTVQDYPGHTITLPVPDGLPAAVRSGVIEGIRHFSSAVSGRTTEWTTAPLLGATAGSQGPFFRLGSFPSDAEGSLLDGTDALAF
jgi:hypothetical protein